jgi:hypothetical protein
MAGVLSESERRRFEQLAGELSQDAKLSRLEKKARKRQLKPVKQRRGLIEWANSRFEDRMRRDRGW